MKKQPLRVESKIKLKDFDPNFFGGMNKEEARAQTDIYCRSIGELQEYLHANATHSLLILLQGMDASGKDGSGRRVLEYVNPTGVETSNFKTPSTEERAHDFLWRVHKAVPRYGNIGVFNRSHYEDVLIVRVLKLLPKEVWQKRYDHINAFEKMLTDNGVVLLKFFLHIDKKEQAKRLEDRLKDPSKNWKFSSSDLEMRKYWDDFQLAYEEAINRCSTAYAPWHVVPANHKWHRDYLISKTVVSALEDLKMKWPKPAEDLSKIKIV
jgi:PPK2 family polyphosphate:nucleotide phosphotransferase